MKKKGKFWHNFKFKYKLTIVNENTLEEIVGLHVSKLNGLSVLLSACMVLFFFAAAVIAFTPLRNYLPGYLNSEIRQQVVTNALRADSLQAALNRHNLYLQNLQDIIGGKIKTDTVQSIDSLANLRAEQFMERSAEEAEFVDGYEERERYNLTAVAEDPLAEGLIFCPPVRGMVTKRFHPDARHYGTDLTVNPNSSVMATQDGTVVFASYTAAHGYVIQLQHTQNYLSTYKYCGSLLKQEGDAVKAGEAIALTGRSEAQKDKPHIHFELWHKGKPINPEKYIVF